MKSNKFKSILILVFILFSFSLFNSFAFAAEKGLEVEYPEIGEQEGLRDDVDLPEYVKYIFQISLIVVALASFVVLIYGGFVFLTSGGSPVARNEGKNWLLSGILGLIIALCFYLILNAINPELLKIRFSDLNGPDTTTPLIDTQVIDILEFQEIPIGTLVENLLAKNINCYNYNDEGDMTEPPEGYDTISGVQGGVDMMKDHDRLDCIKKLAEAVKIKVKKLKDLAEMLKALIDQCDCSNCSYSSGACYGDPCPDREGIDALREEIKALVTGEGMPPDFLSIREGIKRLKKMKKEQEKDLNYLIAAEVLMKQDCKYGTPFSLVKFSDFKKGKENIVKKEFEDFDIREYCIKFNCIEWKFENDPKKKFCIEYGLNEKGRLCGATTTEETVQATGEKDIKEYFVFDGDPASFYCSLRE